MSTEIPKEKFDLIALISLLFGLAFFIYIIIEKIQNNQDVSKFLLLIPPILSSIALIRLYRKIEKQLEIILAVAAMITSLSLCLETIPVPNNAFQIFMQNSLGYTCLSTISAILIAKVAIMCADHYEN
ncbi:hypothetical protein AB9Q29_008200 [Pantoea vagans]|uniref:hypothetical protein n=1 Tax=Pantoea vagans TaxID=470934 RepID=UPI0035196C02